jgi:hypothetical protein
MITLAAPSQGDWTTFSHIFSRAVAEIEARIFLRASLQSAFPGQDMRKGCSTQLPLLIEARKISWGI